MEDNSSNDDSHCLTNSMKKYYLISVLNPHQDTPNEIAEILTPDSVIQSADCEWEFCDIKSISTEEAEATLNFNFTLP